MKPYLFLLLLVPAFLPASPLYSPTWGFYLDLPEGYEMTDGNNVDRYSFEGPLEAKFDIAVYVNTYDNVEQLAQDINRRLENKGDAVSFAYGGKTAVLIELEFQNYAGLGLCMELAAGANGNAPLLVALSYSDVSAYDMMSYFSLSALNSFAPSEAERSIPGPIMEALFPDEIRGQPQKTSLAGTGLTAMIRENDAEIAQNLIEMEFEVMKYYIDSPVWQDAWIRYYRMIYRDSRDRIADAVSVIEKNWNRGMMSKRTFAEKVLSFVQEFQYERDLAGSDFINLVSAVSEGRGDCDSRAMLFAMILAQAKIPSAIMVSREYSHAMGLADIPGAGARFEAGGTKWLVAETTAEIGIGLIRQDVSNFNAWLGILFD